MKRIIACLLVLTVCLGFAGCKSSQPESTEAPLVTPAAETTEVPETTAPVFENFQDLNWTRDSENCIETITFRSNGSCSYTCACGNPVNDDDLCEGYRYEEETKTIVLDFLETTEETITQITVASCDGKTLVLDFAGDLRTFQLEENAA